MCVMFAMELAPFLWLRFVGGAGAAVSARDGRDRAVAASANVDNAGVEGLLARPLLVVTGVGTEIVGVGSFLGSVVSGFGAASFLLGAVMGVLFGGADSDSAWVISGLAGTGGSLFFST